MENPVTCRVHAAVETFVLVDLVSIAKVCNLAKKPDGDVSDLEWIRPGHR